jgi:hypothetical protein
MIGTHVYRREMDLHDMTRPVMGPDIQLSDDGLLGINGAPDFLCNVDVVRDPNHDRFFAVTEQHPFPKEMPNFLAENLQVISMDGVHVRRGGGRWTVEGVVGPALTGLPRNHNAGLVRTPLGTLPDPARIRVVLTDTCNRCSFPALMWECDLWAVEGTFRSCR